ncbi:hypothetical protein Q3G72_029195 [Acer saccharum]|nr:hypothetical protein Q3G72_029195 [Acer saccharum]
MAAAKRRRISYPRSDENQDQSIANKGNRKILISQAMKRRRISYPESNESLDGSVADKSHFVVYTTDKKKYVISLVGRRMPEELEKALFTSTATYHRLASSSSLAQGQSRHQELISGY